MSIREVTRLCLKCPRAAHELQVKAPMIIKCTGSGEFWPMNKKCFYIDFFYKVTSNTIKNKVSNDRTFTIFVVNQIFQEKCENVSVILWFLTNLKL